MVESFNAGAPAGINNSFETAQFAMWCWMITERAFLKGAIQGIIISITFSAFVLLLATFNWIQALVCILCIASIVTSVTSLMVFQGWELGVSESVGVVILIGFSVDYVVHISKHY